jgi:hypothetical protein
MKKEAIPKPKGLKQMTPNENRGNPKASFAKLMLESEGDTFWFSLKREMLTANHTREI